MIPLARRALSALVSIAAVAGCLPVSAGGQERLGERTVARNDAIGHYQYSVRRLSGRDDTRPGQVSAPYPTFHHLAVEWEIEGDDNLNSLVAVAFRPAGETAWRDGMPLRRVPAQTWHDPRQGLEIPWANKHSGTLFNLDPDTEYEIRLRLHDPDGGEAEHTLRARTRAEPRPTPGAPVRPATPQTLQTVIEAAQPGDIVELEPGNYGFFAMPKDGEPGRPIVLRSRLGDAIYLEGDRSAVPPRKDGREGEAFFEGISLQGRKYVHLLGVVSVGPVLLWNCEECVVRRSRVYGVWGITATSQAIEKWLPEVAARLDPYPTAQNFETVPRAKVVNSYIADNVVIGVAPWARPVVGSRGRNMGEGIEISGPGNVIAHNRVIGFRDCISIIEGRYAVTQQSVDVYNNDLEACADDGIEFDYYANNGRVLRNRMVNVHRGISAGPGFGGPAYFIRNVFYNTLTSPINPNRAGSGAVVLHNTAVKSGPASSGFIAAHSYGFYRNNLLVGGGIAASGDRLALIVAADSSINGLDTDYTGYGNAPGPLLARIGERQLEGIDEVRQAWEPHAIEVGLETFAGEVEIPQAQFSAWTMPDLRLREGSAAVDAGEILTGVNDGFGGSAPDLGAFELGQPLPTYGPRPMEVSEAPPYPPSPVISGIDWDLDTRRQFGIGSDQWPMTRGADGAVYGAWGDGHGWSGVSSGLPKRSIGVTRITGNPPELQGEDLWGDGPGRGFGKPEALIALGDTLYMFWTHGDSNLDDDTRTALSTDGGKSWSLGGTKAFPGVPDGFRVRGIVQFGPGYRGAPDDYVYVYFGFNRASDMFLARVPRDRLFSETSYEWFSGVDARGKPRWAAEFTAKQPAFHDDNGYIWHLGVSYVPALGRYLLAKPHHGPGDSRTAALLRNSGVAALGIFDAPTPWGPWTTVFYEDEFIDEHVKFTYMIPTAYVDPEGEGFWLAWSGWPEYDNVNFIHGTLKRR